MKKLSERRTAQGHVWICATAINSGHIGVMHRAFAGTHGNERFERCGFATSDFEAAYSHADIYAGSHWVYEHPRGDADLKPRRSMHGSDGGGAYIDPVGSGWHTDSFIRKNVITLTR